MRRHRFVSGVLAAASALASLSGVRPSPSSAPAVRAAPSGGSTRQAPAPASQQNRVEAAAISGGVRQRGRQWGVIWTGSPRPRYRPW